MATASVGADSVFDSEELDGVELITGGSYEIGSIRVGQNGLLQMLNQHYVREIRQSKVLRIPFYDPVMYPVVLFGVEK